MAARSDMEVYFAPLLRGGVRRPAIHPAEYGHPWSWAGDTLAAWHNGLRAELVDLFNIVESMTVRRSELGDRELDEAYAWWVLFRRFLGDYWAVEHLLLFPAVDIFPTLLDALDRFAPRLLELFALEERFLPPLIAALAVVLLTRWMGDTPAREAWLRANLRGPARGLRYGRWKREFDAGHRAIVRRFHRRMFRALKREAAVRVVKGRRGAPRGGKRASAREGSSSGGGGAGGAVGGEPPSAEAIRHMAGDMARRSRRLGDKHLFQAGLETKLRKRSAEA
ncbi:hypothetical protein I4F81_003816 [Pyropia yezoensis]|uniref:Uncharacterized protein n=1 Tax=Pyropia yezoensis TaxID=2788 RepID=A0ACC3BTP4_PYRYE|nr:hypothetical protein I4F81_003816 [Neopyropia yezoensis]